MAELFLIGTIDGASGFPKPELCAKWALIVGDGWTRVEGEDAGQTQVDLPGEDERFTVWSHPIDVHYATKTLSGWPKLMVQVFRQDAFGRNELYGYGFTHIPTTPGTHSIEISTWRPAGTMMDQVWTFFLGATPQLKSMDLVHNPSDRFRLHTRSMGRVHLTVAVAVRGFDEYGVLL
ncbi:B9 domain-containing protein 2-like protein [Chytriomyces sp. MP71]|nr:B9 domain-containing protein 2-like protein [Chytriomyces sp. MP71]